MSTFEAQPRQLGAVILAGGRGTRLPAKCFRMLGDRGLIVHVFERISQVTQEIVVAVKDTEQASAARQLLPAAWIVLDGDKSESPLVGFLSALRVITTPYVFAAPCDTPFIEPNVIRLLLKHALGNDGAIPINEDKMAEPLCAIYRRESALKAARNSIESGSKSMADVLARLAMVMRVPADDIRKVDPGLLTFRNINTEQDLRWASQFVKKYGRG